MSELFVFHNLLIRSIPTLSLLLLIGGCSAKAPLVIPGMDYSLRHAWAALPDTQSPAATTPFGSGLSSLEASAKVDVFYLHPTTHYGTATANATPDDRKAAAATDGVLMTQASAFNAVGRIYAPRYRQMALYLFDATEETLQEPLNLAYEDVRQAFRTYLKDLNQGRPFIIAGHSQGANHAQRLLIEEVVGRPCAKRFVAAWIPGLALPRAMLDTTAGGGLTASATAHQLGGVAIWETFGEGFTDRAKWVRGQVYWHPGRQRWVAATPEQPLFSVNPLTWEEGSGLAPATLNLGSVPYGVASTSFRGVLPALVSARNDHGYLVASPPPPKATFLSGAMGDPLIYHMHDFSLFWMNIRANARERVHTFLLQRQQVRHPLIESATTLTGEVGRDLRYRIRTINQTQSFAATGLPAGLILDAQTGIISGRPQAPGTFAVVLRATNPHGTDTAELAVTILESTTQSSLQLSLSATPPRVKMN